jgi:curved DNA-binding protein CbpA
MSASLSPLLGSIGADAAAIGKAASKPKRPIPRKSSRPSPSPASGKPKLRARLVSQGRRLRDFGAARDKAGDPLAKISHSRVRSGLGYDE